MTRSARAAATPVAQGSALSPPHATIGRGAALPTSTNPSVAAHRALQRIVAAAVLLDGWDVPLIGPADLGDFVAVRRDRYDTLAAACIAYLEAEP